MTNEYINTTTLMVSDLNTIRAAHPNMSIPDGAGLTDIGYARYERTAQPAYNAMTQGVREVDPVPVDGVYQQQWVIHELSEEQKIQNKNNAIESVWTKIKSKRDFVKHNGVKIDDKWFHTDDSSRIQQLGLVLMGTNVPAVDWKTMDGTFVLMTPTLASQIFTAVATLDMTAFQVAESHRVAMSQTENPYEYDFSGNWPESFSQTN